MSALSTSIQISWPRQREHPVWDSTRGLMTDDSTQQKFVAVGVRRCSMLPILGGQERESRNKRDADHGFVYFSVNCRR